MPPPAPARDADVWAAACRGPLAWLCALPAPAPAHAERTQGDAGRTADCPSSDSAEAAATDQAEWAITPAGEVQARAGAGDADLLTLAPFAQTISPAAAGDRYLLSAASVAAAAARGHDPARLRAVLLRRCRALPPELEQVLSPAPVREGPAQPSVARRQAPRRPRSAPRAGFFAGPPDPPPGSPLIEVWLDEGLDEPVGRRGAELADAVDGDPLGRSGVEGVVAHAVGRGVAGGEQLAPEGGELLSAQPALERAAWHA